MAKTPQPSPPSEDEPSSPSRAVFGSTELLDDLADAAQLEPTAPGGASRFRPLGTPTFVLFPDADAKTGDRSETALEGQSVGKLAISRDELDAAVPDAETYDKVFPPAQDIPIDLQGPLRPGVELPLKLARPAGWSPGAGQGGPAWYGWGGASHPASRRHATRHMRSLLPGVPDDCGDVGVFVVDSGISAAHLARPSAAVPNGSRLRGGIRLLGGAADALNTQPVGRFSDPYARQADGHGNMVARNVLSLAPSAAIYDVPLLPEKVTDTNLFSSVATLLFWAIRFVIGANGAHGLPKHRHWIVVNAWAVADRFADTPGPFSYADRPDHPLNDQVARLAAMNDVDVVFAAGNSGELAPDPFSGPYDRGAGRSIWGANGLPGVHTVGAVTPGGRTIAASSQGPSLPALAGGVVNRKPDLAAPSWFHEDDDASTWNTGTSAAAALFAGWLACLRSAGTVHPVVDKAADATEWSMHAGHPILSRAGLLSAGAAASS